LQLSLIGQLVDIRSGRCRAACASADFAHLVAQPPRSYVPPKFNRFRSRNPGPRHFIPARACADAAERQKDHNSNFGTGKPMSWVYLPGTLDAAIWGAELAKGDGRGRIYIVEPTGPIIDDPNLTDKKFPGNPTQSYRSRDPLRVTGEVRDWQGHSPERLKEMRDNLARLKAEGAEVID
jgi:rifampin ADP-ribosylating transferase